MRPHAISGMSTRVGCTNQQFQYDNNGNMLSGLDRTIEYSHFDQPVKITNTNDNSVSQFTYGTDRSRIKRVTTQREDDGTGNSEQVTTTTYYIGPVEVISKSNSNVITTRRNLPGAVELRRSNNTREINYLLKDHLGSIDTLVNENNQIIQKLYYDPWGKKRQIDRRDLNIVTSQYLALTLSDLLDITSRGFTGHESIDHADIIHMNGRIYDPTLGRFLQADPHIQAPTNTQNYNRYSYVLNNPLSYTDPSGYFIKKLFKKLNKALGKFAPVFGIALMFIPGMQAWAAQSIWHAAAVGFGIGGVSTGSLKGALIGAFSGAVFNQIGTHFTGAAQGSLGQITAHGLTGG